MCATGNSCNIVHDLGRRITLCHLAITKLAALVGAPCPEGTIGLERGGENITGRNGRHIIHDSGWNCLRDALLSHLIIASISIAAITELSVIVISPHPENAVRVDDGGGGTSAADGAADTGRAGIIGKSWACHYKADCQRE